MQNNKKQERIREKKLNNSLTALTKEDQQKFGIISVQKEHGVFFLGHDLYVKVYLLDADFNQEGIKKLFVKRLCASTLLRVRLSSVYKMEGGATIRYLTVYVLAGNYAEAYKNFGEFDNALSRISLETGIIFRLCSVNDVIQHIYMNFGNFPQAKSHNFTGVINTKTPERLWKFAKRINTDMLSSIDIQVMTKKETEAFNFNLEKRFNCHIYKESIPNINVSFLISFLAGSSSGDEWARKGCWYSKDDFELIFDIDKQDSIYMSVSTLGLMDFHIMRNASESAIQGLFM